MAHVELIIPGLFDLPLNELDREFLERNLPCLNAILRYGVRLNNQAYDLDSMLAQSLGLSPKQSLPLAQAFVEEPSSDEGSYILCRAVHLKADMRNAIVLPLDKHDETTDHISILINDLNELFKVDCDIKPVSNQLYLAHFKHCNIPHIYPHYLSILGKKANQYMEQSKAMLPWYQLVNEIQMFMHGHEVNQQRLENGLLPINSLWCWGGGQLPELPGSRIQWFTDDEILRSFAHSLGIFKDDLAAFSQHDIEGNTVCIDLSILETLKSVQQYDLTQMLSRIEQQLFEVLVPQIKSRRCRLKLRAGHEFDLDLSAFSFYQFWKKPQNLLHFQGN